MLCFNIVDNDLFVGMTTKMRLRKLLEDGDISPAQRKRFYDSARAFYVRALEYAIDTLPLNDDLLSNARFIDFHSRENSNFSQVQYFVNR